MKIFNFIRNNNYSGWEPKKIILNRSNIHIAMRFLNEFTTDMSRNIIIQTLQTMDDT